MSKPRPLSEALLSKSVKTRAPTEHPTAAPLAALSQDPPQTPPEVEPPPPPADPREPGPGLTLYLTRSSWRQLKELGMDVRKPVHALLIEAVNLLFEKHGRPQTAEAGERPKVKPKV